MAGAGVGTAFCVLEDLLPRDCPLRQVLPCRYAGHYDRFNAGSNVGATEVYKYGADSAIVQNRANSLRGRRAVHWNIHSSRLENAEDPTYSGDVFRLNQ